MMAGIRGKDTAPELVLRKGLHARGFRFRLHDRALPGRPDLVFPKHRAVLFAHGCFFHGHECALFRWPSSRPDFWRAKITGNRERDAVVIEKLVAAGWRVGVVWECAMKGGNRLTPESLLTKCERWLRSNRARLEVRGE
jgi:DNA mismatch endonuclease (patch repair protein)